MTTPAATATIKSTKRQAENDDHEEDALLGRPANSLEIIPIDDVDADLEQNTGQDGVRDMGGSGAMPRTMASRTTACRAPRNWRPGPRPGH